MQRASVALVLVALCSGPVPSCVSGEEIVRTFKTSGDAILCMTADKLPEGYQAAKAKDRSRMDQAGCFPTFAGVAATRVDTEKGSPLWQVLLDPKGPEPMTVWAYHYAFRSENGERLDADGRAQKADR